MLPCFDTDNLVKQLIGFGVPKTNSIAYVKVRAMILGKLLVYIILQIKQWYSALVYCIYHLVLC